MNDGFDEKKANAVLAVCLRWHYLTQNERRAAVEVSAFRVDGRDAVRTQYQAVDIENVAMPLPFKKKSRGLWFHPETSTEPVGSPVVFEATVAGESYRLISDWTGWQKKANMVFGSC